MKLPRIISPSKIFFIVNDEFAVELRQGHTYMNTTLSIGHLLNCAIQFLDQNGNPMLVTPSVDAPPTWSNTTPATETLAPASDGMSAVATPVAAGSDTINLTLTSGGQSFSASLSVTVTAAPQVLGSIVIVPTVVAAPSTPAQPAPSQPAQ